MCITENDDDMKIVGSAAPKTADAAAAWQQHKACGNIDRAHRLGAILAQQLTNLTEDDPALLLQQQMLFSFTVYAGCPALLPDELLTQTARGTFFDRLRSLLPGFEETLRRLGAFTFYRLCVDGDAENRLPAEKIGTVFAALCGKADDPAVEAEGTALFRTFFKRLEDTVSRVEFMRIHETSE